MRTILLYAAALTCGLPTAAASAFDPPANRSLAESGASVRIHRQSVGPGLSRDDRRNEWRGDHRGDDRYGYGYGYGYAPYYEPGQWARYNNRSWEPDSFNDWWHDNPRRSMPRWTQDNRRTCRQQYWTSAGWTC